MIEFKRILVPLDFSESSRKALAYGVAFAKAFDARLILAHVVAEGAALSYAFPVEVFAMEKDQKEWATKELQNWPSADVSSGMDIKRIVKVGPVEEELLGILSKESADLVVLGTHGRRAPMRWFIGSVTEHMLRRVSVPVLTVGHSESTERAKDEVSFKRILYASDFGESSRSGMQYAVELAKKFGAELGVVSAVEYFGLANGESERRLADSRRKIQELIALGDPGVSKVEGLLLEGTAYRKILEAAETRGSDCIVINLRSKSVVERALLGSTAERVVRLARVPVFGIPFAG